MKVVHFPAHATLILFLSIFGHKFVLKSPALLQGKELQVTRFKVMLLLVLSNAWVYDSVSEVYLN